MRETALQTQATAERGEGGAAGAKQIALEGEPSLQPLGSRYPPAMPHWSTLHMKDSLLWKGPTLERGEECEESSSLREKSGRDNV